MSRRSHPDKEIESAISYAESNGWTIDVGGSHAWGKMYCPENRKCNGGYRCIVSIWSTPKNSKNHSEQIKRTVDSCPFKSRV